MPEFAPRRAEPGQRFGYTTSDGRQREIRADEDGVVHPRSADDVAVLDTFALPEARIAEDGGTKPAGKPSRSRSASPKAEETTDTKGPGHPDAKEGD